MIPKNIHGHVKKICVDKFKTVPAFVHELLKERVDEMLSCEDWDDIHAARKEFKTGKSIAWRSIKRG